MATLSGFSSPFQPAGSSTRVNTAQLFNNNGRANFRVKSWLEQYLKQQEEAAAEKKAAEEAAAAAEQAAAEQAAAEQAAAEQAAFESQKQAYKDNADFIYEPGSWGGYINLSESYGVSSDKNMYVNMSGVSPDMNWSVETGSGDDVFYMGSNKHTPSINTDPEYSMDGDFYLWDYAKTGDGNDKIFGGDGSQSASAGSGDDVIDLGNGFDAALGGYGSDEFVINLEHSGVDMIRDFLNIGDKITIYNGGKLAEADDWMLVSVGSEWTGPTVANINLAGANKNGHSFYEIQDSEGKAAAIFSAGTKILGESFMGADYIGNKFGVTVQQGASGLEVIESKVSNTASIEFV